MRFTHAQEESLCNHAYTDGQKFEDSPQQFIPLAWQEIFDIGTLAANMSIDNGRAVQGADASNTETKSGWLIFMSCTHSDLDKLLR